MGKAGIAAAHDSGVATAPIERNKRAHYNPLAYELDGSWGQRGLAPRILAVFWLYGTAMAGCPGCMGPLWN